MNLWEHGAAHLAGAAAPFLADLERLLAALPAERAGIRLTGVPGLAGILEAIAGRAAQLAGRRPVRAILFDKSATANWALGWHQDRTIAVRSRAELDGYRPWARAASTVSRSSTWSIGIAAPTGLA